MFNVCSLILTIYLSLFAVHLASLTSTRLHHQTSRMTKLFGLSVILAFWASSATATDHNTTELLEERATAKRSCMITLNGVGRFNQYVKYDFAKWSNFPLGLSVSDYGIEADPEDDEHPFDQHYGPNNVILKRGRPLQLRVPGGQKKSPIQGAEFTTAYDDILYASVRTVAKVSAVPGTCHGIPSPYCPFCVVSSNMSRLFLLQVRQPRNRYRNPHFISRSDLPYQPEVIAYICSVDL
jgi:hypothetical protein